MPKTAADGLGRLPRRRPHDESELSVQVADCSNHDVRRTAGELPSLVLSEINGITALPEHAAARSLANRQLLKYQWGNSPLPFCASHVLREASKMKFNLLFGLSALAMLCSPDLGFAQNPSAGTAAVATGNWHLVGPKG